MGIKGDYFDMVLGLSIEIGVPYEFVLFSGKKRRIVVLGSVRSLEGRTVEIEVDHVRGKFASLQEALDEPFRSYAKIDEAPGTQTKN